MLGTLLESRANKQRRGGGAAASVIVHSVIITLAVVATAAGRPAPATYEKPTYVNVTPAPTKVEVAHAEPQQSVLPQAPSTVVIKNVDVPTITPTSIPPIVLGQGPPADSFVFNRPGAASNGRGRTIIDGADQDGKSEWTVNEIMMNVLTPAKPRYPESLRSAGIDGRVLVEFIVDTTGRVDMNSVKILSSTHDLFSRSVRDALGNFRFRPAESGGRHIPALAQMPFEFQITK